MESLRNVTRTAVRTFNGCLLLILLFCLVSFSHASAVDDKAAPLEKPPACRNVIIVPLDSRNQTYDYIRHIVRICGYNPVVPPREMMGNISAYEDAYKKQYNVWFWLSHNLDENCGILILSADSLIYGGLLESRNSPITEKDALNNADLLRIIRKRYPHIKILVYTSIPRKEARQRARNFAVNMRLLELAKEDVIDFLSISGDDVTDISNQVLEIAKLKDRIVQEGIESKVFISDVDRIRLGIDESAMVIFIRHLNHLRYGTFRVYIEYRDITGARMEIDRYSATPIMSVALDMVNAIGGEVTYDAAAADLVLAVNHSSRRSSDDNFLDRIQKLMETKPVTIGDVSTRDEKAAFFQKLYTRGLFPSLAGYATWGMGTNTMGTSLSMGCAALISPDLPSYLEFQAFLYERMLADYIYLNNIHLSLAKETGIPAYSLERMSPDREKMAINLTTAYIQENLKNLGIVPVMVKRQAVPGEENKEIDTGTAKINYIPLDPAELGTTPSEEQLVQFTVAIPAERQVGTGGVLDHRPLRVRITAGPVSFPFHRLFEVRIPVNAALE